jgi:hypothetical protein
MIAGGGVSWKVIGRLFAARMRQPSVQINIVTSAATHSPIDDKRGRGRFVRYVPITTVSEMLHLDL